MPCHISVAPLNDSLIFWDAQEHVWQKNPKHVLIIKNGHLIQDGQLPVGLGDGSKSLSFWIWTWCTCLLIFMHVSEMCHGGCCLSTGRDLKKGKTSILKVLRVIFKSSSFYFKNVKGFIFWQSGNNVWADESLINMCIGSCVGICDICRKTEKFEVIPEERVIKPTPF